MPCYQAPTVRRLRTPTVCVGWTLSAGGSGPPWECHGSCATPREGGRETKRERKDRQRQDKQSESERRERREEKEKEEKRKRKKRREEKEEKRKRKKSAQHYSSCMFLTCLKLLPPPLLDFIGAQFFFVQTEGVQGCAGDLIEPLPASCGRRAKRKFSRNSASAACGQ